MSNNIENNLKLIGINSKNKLKKTKNIENEAKKETEIINTYAPSEREREYPLSKFVSAPLEWNFFEKINTTYLEDLVESILEIGLQSPIVSYEININDYEKIFGNLKESIKKEDLETLNNLKEKNEKFVYMMLAGHTRYSAFKLLEKDNPERFSKIYSRLYREHSIDFDTMKQIIIDTNILSKNLKKTDLAKCILKKYEILKNQKKKQPFKIIANQLNLEERQVKRYKAIASLSDNFGDLLDTQKLTLSNVEPYSTLPKKVQDELLTKFTEMDLKEYIPVIKKCNLTYRKTTDEEERKKIKTSEYVFNEINKFIEEKENFEVINKKVKIVKNRSSDFNSLIETLTNSLNEKNLNKKDLTENILNIINNMN